MKTRHVLMAAGLVCGGVVLTNGPVAVSQAGPGGGFEILTKTPATMTATRTPTRTPTRTATVPTVAPPATPTATPTRIPANTPPPVNTAVPPPVPTVVPTTPPVPATGLLMLNFQTSLQLGARMGPGNRAMLGGEPVTVCTYDGHSSQGPPCYALILQPCTMPCR